MKQLLAVCVVSVGLLSLPETSDAGHYRAFYVSAPGVYRSNGYHFPPTVYYGPFPQATYQYPQYRYAPIYYGPTYYGPGNSFYYAQPGISIGVSRYGWGQVPYSYGGRRGFQRGYRHR